MTNPDKRAQTEAANEARRRSAATKRERSRRSISAAAARLFSILGYPDTRVNDIATAAGVSTPTVFNYKDSKAALGWDVIEAGFESSLGVAKGLQAEGKMTSKLMAEVFCGTFAVYPGIGHSLYDHKGTDIHDVSQALPKTHGQFMGTIITEQAEGVMRADIDPAATASFVISALASQPAQVARDPARTNLHVSILFDGLAP